MCGNFILQRPDFDHDECRTNGKNHADGAAVGASVERTEPIGARACLAGKTVPSRGGKKFADLSARHYTSHPTLIGSACLSASARFDTADEHG